MFARWGVVLELSCSDLPKYLLRFSDIAPPRKISFTVIDNVLEWAETWRRLADAVEDEFRSS